MNIDERIKKVLSIISSLNKRNISFIIYNTDNIKKVKSTITNNNVFITSDNLDNIKYDKNKTYLIDFSHITDSYNHLISADFNNFDFTQLLKESKNKDYNGIKWINAKIPKNYKDLDKNYVCKRDFNFNYGDFVYIYYKNLPCINKTQVLLKCIVIDDGYISEDNIFSNCFEIYDNYKFKVPCVRLKIINCFDNKKNMITGNDLINIHHQGKIHLDGFYTTSLKKSLLSKLEKNLTASFSNFLNYKDLFCYECSLKELKDDFNHKTFIRKNGLKYYEFHHLIERNVSYENDDFDIDFKKIEKIVDDDVNLFPLCSNCHNRIHYGTIEDRKIMLNKLYNSRKKELDELYFKLKKNIPDLKNYSIIDFLYKLYNIDK